MKRKKILLCILFLCILFSCAKTTTIKAQEEKLTTADISQIFQHKNNNEIVISYILEAEKELIFKTSENKVIDLEALKNELGNDNVDSNTDQNEFKLKLDKPDGLSFKLITNNEKPFTLTILKADGEKIFDYDLNQPESKNVATETDDDSNESGWVFSEFLKVSEGPILEHSDGSSTRPLLYFGDYNMAQKRASISESYASKGNSRNNSLTAANSAILYAEPNSRILDGPKASGNHIYTSHYGDHQEGDFESKDIINMGISPRGIEDKSEGSPRNFISNNLYNYVVPTDGHGVPGVSGPDILGEAYGLPETPKFYYRTNPQTGLEEQKMVYKQRAFYVPKKNHPNPEITTTIKQSFNDMGRVVTKIVFKNTGNYYFTDFVGFSNQDFSLNKDGREITDKKGKRIGNYVSMRTLGNKRGMYIQSGDNQVRHSVYVNNPNGPNAWAARSTAKSYKAYKGFAYNPGLIGLIPLTERYYPWKSGKNRYATAGFGRPTKFFDKKKNQFKSPYVKASLFNAFEDLNDRGDTDNNSAAGTRLGVTDDDFAQWDSGLTMRTTMIDLPIGKSTTLQYMTQTDVRGTTFNPVIELDLHGTEDNPQLLPVTATALPITGQWYDYDSTRATMHYSIDSDKDEDYQILFNTDQSSNDAFNGKHHEIQNQKVNLKNLDKGTHVIRFYMEDAEGHRSPVKTHYIRFIKESTKAPQFIVTTPQSSQKDPHDPMDTNLELSGYWTDKDSKSIKEISYTLDNDPTKKVIFKDLKNNKPGSMVDWKLDEFSISDCNDFKLHKLTFTIVDDKNLTGTEEFYFQHQPGGLKLSAPEKIDLGTVAITPNGSSLASPKIDAGRVVLDDFRQKNSGPVAVSLSMDTFYKLEENAHHDTGVDPDGEDEDEYRLEKESIGHTAYWDKKLVDSHNFIIGETNGKNTSDWQYSTDFTDQILKKLQLSFNSKDGGSMGTYVSHWTWQTVDSIE